MEDSMAKICLVILGFACFIALILDMKAMQQVGAEKAVEPMATSEDLVRRNLSEFDTLEAGAARTQMRVAGALLSTASEVSEDATIQEVKEDSYEIFVTDEEWAKRNDGFCIERDGKLYTLCDVMPSTVISEYNCGYQTGGDLSENGDTKLYLYDQEDVKDVPTEATNALISVGDFPVYYIDPGEELRIYSSQPIEHVTLKGAEFYGYTIPAIGRYIYFPIRDHLYTELEDGLTNPAVLTPDGDPVEDVRKLEYGKQYMFEWYENTKYHSQTFAANSRCYLVDDDNLAFNVPVKPTEDGYSIVDLSEVEPDNTYTILGMNVVFELR